MTAAMTATTSRAAPGATLESVLEPSPARRPLSSSEYLHLAEAGYFEGERIELIEGEILRMSPIGSSHTWLVGELVFQLNALLEGRNFVASQASLRLDDGSTVEPDVFVLRGPRGGFREPHPAPVNVLLVIEVAESSLRGDLGPKAKLYSRAGIGEYWVVSVERQSVFVHRDPGPDGYREATEHAREARLPLPGRPDLVVEFARVFR